MPPTVKVLPPPPTDITSSVFIGYKRFVDEHGRPWIRVLVVRHNLGYRMYDCAPSFKRFAEKLAHLYGLRLVNMRFF